MPIYEYECTKCGEVTEALQKFSDPPLTKCKQCSGKMKKVMSQNSFHLKGSGWYVTDYASGHAGSTPSKEDSKETPTGKKADEGTKDKPKKDTSSPNDRKDKD